MREVVLLIVMAALSGTLLLIVWAFTRTPSTQEEPDRELAAATERMLIVWGIINQWRGRMSRVDPKQCKPGTPEDVARMRVFAERLMEAVGVGDRYREVRTDMERRPRRKKGGK